MVQRRGRPLKGFDDGSSSEEEEDAFASISKKKKPRLAASFGGESDKPRLAAPSDDNNKNKKEDTSSSSTLPIGETSSNKRHHHTNAARQAKMDALLQELKTAKPSESSRERGGGDRDDYNYGSIYDGEGEGYNGYDRFAPMKKGSYVEPGMEHLTTNLFVGNLDPMTTEEELTDTFRQFGDLYSVKIMWPRTAEERARNRNTGFVCFMHRADAEDAMDELCDADPLGVGRRMVLRWGKNVKKTVKFGTGGVPTNLRKKPRDTKMALKRPTNASRDPMEISTEKSDDKSDRSFDNTEPATKNQNSDHQHIPNTATEQPHPAATEVKTKQKPLGPIYDPVQHSAEAIIVNAPRDPRRLAFINTVASFVAKDGSIFEQKLIDTQAFNPEFEFLTVRDNDTVPLGSADDEERIAEHIFYRWRVYSFAQGDGNNSWNTIPFVMFEPHGRFWVPPPLNTVAAEEEEEAEKRREDNRQAAQEERRRLAGQKQDCMKTGAQLRRENLDKGAAARLNDWERKVFHELLREKLCASRESICEAMAFAFDKSGAAHEISELLKKALVESGNGISVDTRIARLFLLSDILFNSQQPGVRNAFHYRDAIEDMSPDVFESLGKHGGGRMTKNKLRKAVSSVLGAWVNWSVYNSNFIDELESKFEGREITTSVKANDVLDQNDQDEQGALDIDVTKNQDDAEGDDNLQAVSTTPRGTWTSAENLEVQTDEQDVDGEALDGDIDGEELDDIDGESLDDDDIDGEELDDIDGEALDDEE